jgi:hypothetical protein
MTEELRKLIEEIEEVEDAPGDVGDFQAPTKEEWEFVDKDQVFEEVYGLDISADLLLDGEPQYLGTLFISLGRLFSDSEGSNTIGTDIIQTVRQFTREVNEVLQGAVMIVEEGMVMKPVSDAEILRSLKYAFDNVIKKVKKDVKI